MVRRGSKYYQSPPSRIPEHIMKRREEEDAIATLEAKIVTLENDLREVLEIIEDYGDWLTREEGRHGDRVVRPAHFEI